MLTRGELARAARKAAIFLALLAAIDFSLRASRVPGDIVALAERAMKALWILWLCWVGSNLLDVLIGRYAAKRQLALPMTGVTQTLVRVAVFTFGGLMILESLGIRIGSLLAALGIGSLAVALGLQDTLANCFAGIYITLSKHIRVGDYIKLESGQEGYVVGIGWRATKIRMLPDNLIIVPNTKIGQSIITNYDLPDRELVVAVTFGVDYASDLEQVERVTLEVARDVQRTVAGAVPGFEPVVRFHTFGEQAVQGSVILRARTFIDQYLLIHECLKRLHARYGREGITIPASVHPAPLKSA